VNIFRPEIHPVRARQAFDYISILGMGGPDWSNGMEIDTVEETDGAHRGKFRRLLPILFLALGSLLLFLLLVWPSLYRYPGDSDRFRVNRLTGKAQVYDKKSEAWRPAKRGRNGGGTGASPYDSRGPRSEGPAPGDEGWHDGKGSGSGSRQAKSSQWWYSDAEVASDPPKAGSPIGGSRNGNSGSGGGSPIGGD
jgi:hypothetical protein